MLREAEAELAGGKTIAQVIQKHGTTEIFVQPPTGTLSMLDGKATDDAFSGEDL